MHQCNRLICWFPFIPHGSYYHLCAKNCDNSTIPIKPPVIHPQFPRGQCNDWMFKCTSEQCIPYWWKCDGVPDCDDSSDETQCGDSHSVMTLDDKRVTPVEPEVMGCPDSKFQCSSGKVGNGFFWNGSKQNG